jgi:hypothetical protein
MLKIADKSRFGDFQHQILKFLKEKQHGMHR